MMVRAPNAAPINHGTGACTLHAPPHARVAQHYIAGVTARRLFTRTCSSSPFLDQAVAVGLRCWTVNPQTLFLIARWRSVFICGNANTKTPRSFARLDLVLARDNSGCSVLFPIMEGSTRLATSSPFSKRHNGKEPPRVNLLLPLARAPLQKTPTGSTNPASSFNTLTHAFQATSAPVAEEEDPTLRDGPVVTPRPPALSARRCFRKFTEESRL